MMPAVGEEDLGSVSQLRRRSRRRLSDDKLATIEFVVREELREAPDKRARASIVRTNTFQDVKTLFPILLRKEMEHHMKAVPFLGELTLILNMANINDPTANVYVYSLQVIEPRDFGHRLGSEVLEILPPNLKPEIMNGYFRHELLYGQGEPDISIILVNTVQNATKIAVSLKPPWSAYRTNVVVHLE
jgi:hypothetical protein